MHMDTVKKRSIALSILFTLIVPGLGHIYNGKLKKGLYAYNLLILLVIIPTFTINKNFAGFITAFAIQAVIIIYLLIDCIITAKQNRAYVLHNFNKWYVYILLIVFHLSLINFAGPVFLKVASRYQAFMTVSRSNEPTLRLKERFVIDKWYYKFHDLKRGDMVVLENPDYNEDDMTSPQYVIKRCVALPGDRLEIKKNRVYINGALDDVNIPELPDNDINHGPVVVPDNSFFCLGDNRANSYDSRNYGSIPIMSLFARALYIYWSNDFSKIGSPL